MDRVIHIEFVNLMTHMSNRKEHEDHNEVKVVVHKNNNELYFSREPVPFRKKSRKDVPMLKQVCLINFGQDFLFDYIQREPTPLGIIKSVDMNRILEHGYNVRMIPTAYDTYAVDTEKDRQNVEMRMEKDELRKLYLS